MSEPTNPTCAQCGAVLPASAAHRVTECPYCEATAVPAPRVVERVIERVVVAAPTVEAGGALRCPRCATALREASGDGRVLHGCTSCGGVFIDRENIARFGNADHRAEALARTVIGVVAAAQLLGRPPNLDARIACPIGGEPFVRRTIAFTGREVDVCDTHGVWLDWGEIRAFLRPPTDDPSLELTEDELTAAGLSGRTNADDGFFTNLRRLMFGD